jgi:hypothetical protein
MLFWIKDAAFHAGLTPDLPRAQAYFRDLRKDIQRACRDGRLRCAPDHGGLFPRFEIRWMRSLLEEVGAGAVSTVAPSVSLPGGFQLPVDPDYARQYEVATKARYGDPGGRLPGRLSAFDNPLRPIRELVTERFAPASLLLEALAAAALAVRLRSRRRVAPSPLVLVALVVVAYTVVRLIALAYLSVYVGELGPRFFFSSYAICLLVAAAVLAESAAALLNAPSAPRGRGGAARR